VLESGANASTKVHLRHLHVSTMSPSSHILPSTTFSEQTLPFSSQCVVYGPHRCHHDVEPGLSYSARATPRLRAHQPSNTADAQGTARAFCCIFFIGRRYRGDKVSGSSGEDRTKIRDKFIYIVTDLWVPTAEEMSAKQHLASVTTTPWDCTSLQLSVTDNSPE